MNTLPRRYLTNDRSRLGSMLLVGGAHLVAFYAVIAFAPARHAMADAAMVMVQLLAEQPKVQVKPLETPKPLPVKLQPAVAEPVPPPVVAFITSDPSGDITPTPPTPAPPSPLQAAATPPAQAVPPRFDADYLDNPAPIYPPLSKRAGEQGRVLLHVFVEASGAPSKLEIRNSSGSERLDKAALEAVRRWKFAPAKQGDKTVAAWVLVPIDFSLRNA